MTAPRSTVPAGAAASLLVASDQVLLRLSAEDGSLPAGDDSWRQIQPPRLGAVAMDYDHRWDSAGWNGRAGVVAGGLGDMWLCDLS